jgi:hypothetical protein
MKKCLLPPQSQPPLQSQRKQSKVSSESRPTTGGKQLNSEALKAYIESLKDDISESENEEGAAAAKPEPAREDTPVREDSPSCEADQCHWVYQVWRRSWRTEEDDNKNNEEAQWFVCGKAIYTSLSQANDAAGREILNTRDGLAVGPDARSFQKILDVNDMAHYEVELLTGYIQVKVDRFLRNRISGTLPTSKAGWLKKIGWDIMRKTTTRKLDPCSEESRREVEIDKSFIVQVSVEVVDGVFTIMDEANREAADVILELYAPKNSMRMDDQIIRSREQRRIEEALDALEQNNEAFRETYDKDNDTTIEVYVQQRELKGPRNI